MLVAAYQCSPYYPSRTRTRTRAVVGGWWWRQFLAASPGEGGAGRTGKSPPPRGVGGWIEELMEGGRKGGGRAKGAPKEGGLLCDHQSPFIGPRRSTSTNVRPRTLQFLRRRRKGRLASCISYNTTKRILNGQISLPAGQGRGGKGRVKGEEEDLAGEVGPSRGGWVLVVAHGNTTLLSSVVEDVSTRMRAVVGWQG